VNDGEIFLLDMTTLHCQPKASRGSGIFRDQDKAAGFAIEPVDNGNLPAIDQLEGEQLAQGGPKRRCAVGFGRMNEEEGRLVDYEVIFRLGDNAKFRRRPCAFRGRR